MTPSWEPCYCCLCRSHMACGRNPSDLIHYRFKLRTSTWPLLLFGNLSWIFWWLSHIHHINSEPQTRLSALLLHDLFLKSFLLSLSLTHCINCSLNPSDSSLKKKTRSPSTSFPSFLQSEDKLYYQSFSTIHSPSGWAHTLLYEWHLNFCFQL